MKGAKDLLDSERGIFCIAAVLSVTALAVLGIVTGSQWLTFVQFVLVTLVSSKTLTGAVETITSKTAPPSAS